MGNNCVVATTDGQVVQRNYYYPYGKTLGNGESSGHAAQPYKFGGKENETMLGLELYDFHARQMDSRAGSFLTMDPLAEKMPWVSPYAYCSGNPVNRIDPDGREWKEKKDEEIAKQLQQQIASRDKSLAKQEQKINAQIEKIANNTKLSAEKRDRQIAKQQGKLEDVQAQRTQLSNLDKGSLKSIFGITADWVWGINVNGYYPYTLDKYK